jgi:hypothetical protein
VKDLEDWHPKLFQACASYTLTKEENITFFEYLNSISEGGLGNSEKIKKMEKHCMESW